MNSRIASVRSLANYLVYFLSLCAVWSCSDDRTVQIENIPTTTDFQVGAAGEHLNRKVIEILDVNPDLRIFEANLSVSEQDVRLNDTIVHAIIYKDDNNPSAYIGMPEGIPVPHFIVNVGDEIIVTLNNKLPTDCASLGCDTSIHWHGIELDNDSDGTAVTQNKLLPGESYQYHFIAPRPGLYWFHPHMKPGPQVFAGAYGAMIVRDPREVLLQKIGVLPAVESTFSIVLSEIEHDKNGDVGYLENGVAVPWAQLNKSCRETGKKCKSITDANTVLVNGISPASTMPVIKAKSGSGVRLRLINVASSRYFRLAVTNNNADNNFYRIGGEGGLLETARLEGGVQNIWNSEINQGEVVLGTSQRADVVLIPMGNDGDIISIHDLDFHRGGPKTIGIGSGEILRIQIDNSLEGELFSISEGTEILGVGSIEDIKNGPINDFYIAPVATGNPGDGLGSQSSVLGLKGLRSGQLSIDGVVGEYEDSGGDFKMVPYQGSTRYARTGDLIEFTVSNFTGQHHPFHHHGFSFQVVRIIDNGSDKKDTSDDFLLLENKVNEFVDVVDVFDGQSVVIRMRLDDRVRITDGRQEASAPLPNQFFLSGGAAGRWVFHCHIFVHASLGMISELVVVDTDRDGDGFNTSTDCNDFDAGVNPMALEVCADQVDNNCSGVVDDCL